MDKNINMYFQGGIFLLFLLVEGVSISTGENTQGDEQRWLS
ncbi:MAG: hypothetical protein R6U08_04250 [Bacillota bacterium]